MILAPASDSEALAAAHALSIDPSWSAVDIGALLASPGVFALAVQDGGRIAGFILCRVVADEAEILTLAVLPSHRRRGFGFALLEAGASLATTGGVAAMFLEVAANNPAALALYRRAGFSSVGERANYYHQRDGATSALILRRDLKPSRSHALWYD